MKLMIYSVYDKKTNVYFPPNFAQNDADVLRQFRLRFQDEKNIVHHYPEDYDIYRIGEFDDWKGKIEPEDQPIFIVNCDALLHPEKGKVKKHA